MSKKPRTDAKPISLALQGGGAHGAFTWGVLDHLLDDGRLDIQAISGTSAGAMNAVVFAEGLLDGGPEAAKQQLERFWRSASRDGKLSDAGRTLFENPFLKLWGGFGNNLVTAFTEQVSQVASPYSFNPLNINPLKEFLDDEIRFDELRRSSKVRLYISATNVFTGKVRIFTEKELTADMVVASACLPTMFQSVMIDGEPYWDGGYMGNPSLFPLFDIKSTNDILLVQINPVERREVPHTPQEIHDRMNEISFNSPLLGELRAIDFVARLIDAGKLAQEGYKRVLMHRIDLHEAVKALDAASKLDTSWDFLLSLKAAGAHAARTWLDAHFADIGVRDTMDLKAETR